MTHVCITCNDVYNREERRGKPGLITQCEDCGEESTEKYSGVMIYTHKTGPQIQINKDPKLTKYLIASTKLQNKGSNLGNNLKVGHYESTGDSVLTTVKDSNAKGKS